MEKTKVKQEIREVKSSYVFEFSTEVEPFGVMRVQYESPLDYLSPEVRQQIRYALTDIMVAMEETILW